MSENTQTDEIGEIFGSEVKVETHKGIVIIRELAIEDLAGIADQVVPLIGILSLEDLGDLKNSKVIMKILRNKELLDSIKGLAAVITGKEKTFFDRLGLTDWMKLVKAFFTVNRVEELSQYFLEVVKIITDLTEHEVFKELGDQNDQKGIPTPQNSVSSPLSA